MRTRRFRWALAAILMLPASLWAASPAERAEAAALLQRGFELFEAGAHVDAASAFEQAHGLVPDPLNLRNIARAYEKAERPALALSWLDRHLASDDRPDRIARSRADRARIAAAYLGLVAVDCEPASARVTVTRVGGAGVVDIEGLGAEQACPLQLEVEPGRYQVSATAPGHEAARVLVSVTPTAVVDRALVLAPLGPAAAADTVESTPPPPPEGIGVQTEVERGGGVTARTWVTGAAALASLGAGVAFYVLASDEIDSADARYREFVQSGRTDLAARDAVADHSETAELYAPLSYSLLGVGAALAGLTVYFAVDDLSAPGGTASVLPLHGGGGVAWGGAW